MVCTLPEFGAFLFLLSEPLSGVTRRRTGNGLSEDQLWERLDKLKELHILPEHRV
jgi:hypothetical protein